MQFEMLTEILPRLFPQFQGSILNLSDSGLRQRRKPLPRHCLDIVEIVQNHEREPQRPPS